MGMENIYIAGSIVTTAALGFFAYLHYTSRDEIWRTVWLAGATLMLVFGFGMIRKGFQTVVLDTSLASLTFGVLDVLNWMFVLLSGYLLLQICYWIFRQAIAIFRGKSAYEQKHEPD